MNVVHLSSRILTLSLLFLGIMLLTGNTTTGAQAPPEDPPGASAERARSAAVPAPPAPPEDPPPPPPKPKGSSVSAERSEFGSHAVKPSGSVSREMPPEDPPGGSHGRSPKPGKRGSSATPTR